MTTVAPASDSSEVSTASTLLRCRVGRKPSAGVSLSSVHRVVPIENLSRVETIDAVAAIGLSNALARLSTLDPLDPR
jgi:hypothetical protein